jgi:hypothetical protein
LSSDGLVGQSSPTTTWIRTPKSVPVEAVQNLRMRMVDSLHLILEWDPIETVRFGVFF